MRFTYGVEVGDYVKRFAPPGIYFDEERLETFESVTHLSGRVIVINGPITHIQTDGGRYVKTATCNLPSKVKQ